MARTPAPLEIPPDYESTSPDGNSPIPQSAVERALAIESNKPFKVSISANLPYLPNMYQLLININPIYQYIAYCGPKMAHSGSPPLPSTLIHRSPASLSVSTPRDPPPPFPTSTQTKLYELLTSQVPSIGGAIDVVVVKHPDGSMRSTPFHVRFPAWLFRTKAREVVVEVNGQVTGTHMVLGKTGNAYFVEDLA